MRSSASVEWSPHLIDDTNLAEVLAPGIACRCDNKTVAREDTRLFRSITLACGVPIGGTVVILNLFRVKIVTEITTAEKTLNHSSDFVDSLECVAERISLLLSILF